MILIMTKIKIVDLRSSIGENRLNGLSLFNIHLEIIIKPDEVVDMYDYKYIQHIKLL